LILPALNAEAGKPSSLMEVVDRNLRNALNSASPMFRDFLLEKKPRVFAKLGPVQNEGAQYYSKGDRFRLDIEDGNYNVVKIHSHSEDLFFAYRLQWRGVIQVRRKLAQVMSTFFEIEEGNELIRREFTFEPLAIHESTLGPIVGKKTKLVPLQEGAMSLVGANQVMGIRFPYSDSGPRPGAVLTLDLGMERRGKVLLIDRDQRVGTVWLISADREVTFDDHLL